MKTRPIRTEESYDVVIIGGGLAGITASISAARLGCKVALVHDRPVLGGNSSSEIRVPISGADFPLEEAPQWNRHARETGIIEELRLENKFRNPGDIRYSPFAIQNYSIWNTILWEWVVKEPNIALYLNTKAKKAVMKNSAEIAAIIAEQASTDREFLLKASIFIDASGDGTIAYDAGAKYRIGREGRDEYGESLAPKFADNYTMGSTILFKAKDVGHPVPFTPPPWAKDFSDEDLLTTKTSAKGTIPGRRDHDARIIDLEAHYNFWWIEYGGTCNTIDDTEKIRDELLKMVFGVWDHIKNHGNHGASNYALDWIGFVPGKRESRRFIGDYVLTQNDLQLQTRFPDRVAYGGRPIDLHPPEGIYAKTAPCEFFFLPGLYDIPFRSLYSININNLMMAGRNISVTHVALGSTRVQATCAIIGQAVGTAAFLCKKYNTDPRGIYKEHIAELQQLLLKNDCYIIGLKNEDPNDVAKTASVKVSSSKALEVTNVDNICELDTARAQMFMITEPKIKSIALQLESTISVDTKVQLRLRDAKSVSDFTSTRDIATTTAIVPSSKRSWVTFALNQQVSPWNYYWVSLPAIRGIYWCNSNKEPIATQRGYWDVTSSKWRAEKTRGSYCFKLIPPSKPYGGENLIDGVCRPEDRPHIWISEPRLPQYVELDFGRPTTIDTVYLTFDTNLDKQIVGGAVPECVSDYALFYYERESWVPILEEQKNYQRRKKHSFDAVTTRKLRLEVKATNGVATARIYKIRCYYEHRED